MVNRQEALEPGATYHVYNRAHGNEKIFACDENYRFFLEKYRLYVGPLVDTFCYCLMPNHFHLLIRCKGQRDLELFKRERQTQTGFRMMPQTLSGFAETSQPPAAGDFSKQLSLQFSHFFNSYTQAFNKLYNRKGGLFMRPYQRIAVRDMKYLRTLVIYIHNNPVDAGICRSPSDWSHSSYRSIVAEDNSSVIFNEVVDWFGDMGNFRAVHRDFKR